MVKIYDRDEPVLREIAASIPVSEISSSKIQKVLTDMKAALATQDDGVAICAPQIGVSLRIFVISGRTLAEINGKEIGTVSDKIFINPEIIKISKKTDWMEEGCLSLRYLYGKVKRSVQARVRAYDENGKKFEFSGSGLVAQIFQHEIDHLDGILFTDKAKEVVDIPPGSIKEDE